MSDNFIIANRTDTGRTRQVNEDSMVTFDSPNGRVVAVCDGMGGQAAGDVASRLACDIITDILANNTFATPEEAITTACMAANQGILHRTSVNPELEGMGATCVMVIIKDGMVHYGWIGDSRIYYIANGAAQQISHDQSYVQQLVDSGHITAEEAEHHPQKNEITNALGLATMTPPELGAMPLSPSPGSVILLCSDGLTGMVDNDTIARIVSDDSASLGTRVNRLVDKANANGGLDNITVQLIEFGKGAAATDAHRSGAGSALKGSFLNSKMLVWIAVALAAIIVAVAVGFLLGGEKKKAASTPVQKEKVEVPAPAAAQPAAAPAPKKATATEQPVAQPAAQPATPKPVPVKEKPKAKEAPRPVKKDAPKATETPKQTPKQETPAPEPKKTGENELEKAMRDQK